VCIRGEDRRFPQEDNSGTRKRVKNRRFLHREKTRALIFDDSATRDKSQDGRAAQQADPPRDQFLVHGQKPVDKRDEFLPA